MRVPAMKVRPKLGSRHNDATAQVDSQPLFCNAMVLSFGLEDMLDGNSSSNITWPKGECSQMTYEERVEQAIAANDIETLVKFTYGYPCKCTKIKGEPMCICKMLEKATRAKIVPLPLFSGKIERV